MGDEYDKLRLGLINLQQGFDKEVISQIVKVKFEGLPIEALQPLVDSLYTLETNRAGLLGTDNIDKKAAILQVMVTAEEQVKEDIKKISLLEKIYKAAIIYQGERRIGADKSEFPENARELIKNIIDSGNLTKTSEKKFLDQLRCINLNHTDKDHAVISSFKKEVWGKSSLEKSDLESIELMIGRHNFGDSKIAKKVPSRETIIRSTEGKDKDQDKVSEIQDIKKPTKQKEPEGNRWDILRSQDKDLQGHSPSVIGAIGLSKNLYPELKRDELSISPAKQRLKSDIYEMSGVTGYALDKMVDKVHDLGITNIKAFDSDFLLDVSANDTFLMTAFSQKNNVASEFSGPGMFMQRSMMKRTEVADNAVELTDDRTNDYS